MTSFFKKNCCDGIYNSFDIHFTSNCDNKCRHCIDKKYHGEDAGRPQVDKIAKTIIENSAGYDDVLFLGGEPCLYLSDLIKCIKLIKESTNLLMYVTTSVPMICKTEYTLFLELLELVDGINLSVQHHDERIADEIRRVASLFDRQEFYRNIPENFKKKVRINLNIVKPYLYTKEDITNCISHYDKMGFNEIKISEIQHGTEHFVSFENTFDIKLQSPFSGGCQTYLDPSILNTKTPILLKRSCFMCEDTLKASLMDGVKAIHKMCSKAVTNKYAVVYENGVISQGWK